MDFRKRRLTNGAAFSRNRLSAATCNPRGHKHRQSTPVDEQRYPGPFPDSGDREERDAYPSEDPSKHWCDRWRVSFEDNRPPEYPGIESDERAAD